MQYILRAAVRRGNTYLFYDNPETGKWELPGCKSGSDSADVRIVAFFNMLLDLGIAPLGLRKIYTDTAFVPGSEDTKVITEFYMLDDWAGDASLNGRWQNMGFNAALKLGNLDTACRRYLETMHNKTAYAAVHKEASGPREAHSSVSAVITDEKGGILLMEHPYQKVWSIPKGHIDDGESAREAVVRELEEELGITAPEVEFAGWYVETYRNGENTIPVRHYIYKVVKYDGKVRNAEKDRFGDIKMIYASPDDILKMNDVSLMTRNAVKMLGITKKAGVMPYILGSLFLGQALPLIHPVARKNQIEKLRFDLGKTGILPEEGTGRLGEAIADRGTSLVNSIRDTDWEALASEAGDKVLNAGKALTPAAIGRNVNAWWNA